MKKLLLIISVLFVIPYCNAKEHEDFYYRQFEASRNEDKQNVEIESKETKFFRSKLKPGLKPGEMELQGNKNITKIPKISLPGVKILLLSGSGIEEISPEAKAPELEKLYLSRNNISKFDEKNLDRLLKQFPKLNYLNLSSNPINKIQIKGITKRIVERKIDTDSRKIEIVAYNIDLVEPGEDENTQQ